MKQLLTILALLGTYTLAQAQTVQVDNNRLPQDNHWTYFTGRYNVDLNNKDVPPLVLSIRMKRDSIVWFSLTANVGVQIPVAKGIIHKDTIKIAINEIPNLNPEKVYFEIPVSEALKIAPITLGIKQIQNLFTGQPMVDTCSRETQPKSVYNFSVSHNLLCYTTQTDLLVIKSYFDTTSAQTSVFSQLRLTEISSPNNQKDKAAVEHNQWLDVSKESNGDFKTLPMELKITSTTAQQTAQVDLALTTARYDVIPSYPFKIDDSYKRQPLPLK
jgi:hypothetical protein